MQRGGSSMYSPTSINMNPKFPEHEHLKCPRCDSSNTKFCYYNNYNLSQPRHFCKNCRRYWTKGGTLRNIPIGGGTRKNKRSSISNKRGTNSSPSSSNSMATTMAVAVAVAVAPTPVEPKPEASGIYGYGNDQMEGGGVSFSSLLGSSPGGQFAKLLMDGLNPNLVGGSNEDGLIRNPTAEEFESNFLSVNHQTNNQIEENGGGESSCCNQGDNGWPDLSIYTPVF
ncbi:unnamed protein product [Lactuca virosa]|uniref:Dof zinc finger protein n=1 Tax=Lactuca virosa TaxID=75947 RepID=A0AAU9NXB4_9ASTR|nr:unnamed protein product [Lactuca virosa]